MNSSRIGKIQSELEKSEAYLAVSPADIFYLTGAEVSGCWLLVTNADAVFISSLLMEQHLKHLFPAVEVFSNATLSKSFGAAVADYKIKKIHFTPSALSYETYRALSKIARLIPDKKNIFSAFRAVKSPSEISIIRKNQKITKAAVDYAAKFLKKGVTETFIRKKILEFFLKNDGVPAFEPIVAFGKNSAYPHHISGNTVLGGKDIVLVDAGFRRGGYSSDLTKTFILDKISTRKKEIYDIVKKAQERALSSMKAGILCRDADASARGFIKSRGFEKNFVHGTGHGLGIEVHEKPLISKSSKERLMEGAVVTVEPGIYIPGEFGVRIEDIIVVGKNDCEVL